MILVFSAPWDALDTFWSANRALAAKALIPTSERGILSFFLFVAFFFKCHKPRLRDAMSAQLNRNPWKIVPNGWSSEWVKILCYAVPLGATGDDIVTNSTHVWIQYLQLVSTVRCPSKWVSPEILLVPLLDHVCVLLSTYPREGWLPEFRVFSLATGHKHKHNFINYHTQTPHCFDMEIFLAFFSFCFSVVVGFGPVTLHTIS